MNSLIDAIYSVYGFLNPYMEKWASTDTNTIPDQNGQPVEIPTGPVNPNDNVANGRKLEQFQKIPASIKQQMIAHNPAIGELWNVNPRALARTATPTQ